MAELIVVAVLSCAGWLGEDGLHGEFQKTMGNLEHGYWITSDPLMGEREESKLLESCFIRDKVKPFHELQSELLHLFQCLCVVA